MQDKTMTANARKIMLVTASAFCLSSAGAFLAGEVIKGNSEGRSETRSSQQRQDDGRQEEPSALFTLRR
jgi:hypothetical protein